MDPWYLLIRLLAVTRQMGAAIAEAEKQGYAVAPASLKGAWSQRLDYTDEVLMARSAEPSGTQRNPPEPGTGPPSKTSPQRPRQRKPRSK